MENNNIPQHELNDDMLENVAGGVGTANDTVEYKFNVGNWVKIISSDDEFVGWTGRIDRRWTQIDHRGKPCVWYEVSLFQGGENLYGASYRENEMEFA